MWVAIDILAFIAMGAYVMYVLALAEFHADLLIFAGLLFVAAMVDRVRWSIDHKELPKERNDRDGVRDHDVLRVRKEVVPSKRADGMGDHSGDRHNVS